MTSFWNTIKKPIFVLAPMEEVTDVAFREMFARYSALGSRGEVQGLSRNDFVMFTEFVSTEGLMHEEGRKRLSIDLAFTENQRPIVAQIWGTDPEKFQAVAEYLVELGFDGIDINMGCPQSKEIQAGACAALIRNPSLAVEIINATIKGAGKLPVSVKTRLGYSKTDEMENWAKTLLGTGIANLTMHARTKQEMSKVPAHWEKITELVEIRNRENPNVTIVGNGDIKSREEGLQRVAETGCDGIMVGRGAFGNPWFFASPHLQNDLRDVRHSLGGVGSSVIPSAAEGSLNQNRDSSPQLHSALNDAIGVEERLRVMIEHAELFDKTLGTVKSFFIMRKHFKAYCSGFPGAPELRAKLMETKNVEETKQVVKEYFEQKEKELVTPL